MDQLCKDLEAVVEQVRLQVQSVPAKLDVLADAAASQADADWRSPCRVCAEHIQAAAKQMRSAMVYLRIAQEQLAKAEGKGR